MVSKNYPMPFVRVELVVFCVKGERLHVLLSQRQEAPHKDMWGLPGGALRIDVDQSLKTAVQRVAWERLTCSLPNLDQVVAVGGASRDPRAHWAVSVVYRSLVQPGMPAIPGKRIEAVEWRPVDEIATARALAFDHAELIEQAMAAVREEVAGLRFPRGWVHEPFTYGDLMSLSESVLGQRLDKVTFRRRMAALGVATAIDGQFRTGGPFRPAQLYKFASSSAAHALRART